MKAVRLRTEYLKDPLGIDIRHPRLFWNCEGDRRQTACQVIAETEDRALWDSGKISSASMHIVFPEELLSRQRVRWQVKLWNEKDEEGDWSAPAFFEMGLLNADDWKAEWITGNYDVHKKLRYPVDCFRKTFTVSGPVKKARLYSTACGLYEARIGGKKAGSFCLAPGHTDYRKRIQYQTADVTDLVTAGENEITVQLADGWYRGSCGAWGLKNQYGTQTKLLIQLEIEYQDGSTQQILSDGSWQWSNDGPIRFADNKDGEIIEASRIPSYSGSARITRHPVIPCASNNVPVTEQERLTPVLITTPSGKKVLDFGRNIAGYIEFTLAASRNERVFLRFGEMLDKEGEFTQKNIQCVDRKGTATPLQQIEYYCRDGENHYKTTFAVFGFQYVLVETGVSWQPEDFTAIFVGSELEKTGIFESSNSLLNDFVRATELSARGNFLDIPTDCPTRERHGWTGDAQLFFGTAACLFDFAAFSRKYLCDVYDLQENNGKLPQIAPAGGVNSYMDPLNGSAGWSDAGILIPYRFWKRYGDRQILLNYYDGMKKYARFLESRCGKWGGIFAKRIKLPKEAARYLVNKGQSYGEWAEPAEVHPYSWTDMVAPHPEVSTAYTAWMMKLMAEAAHELGFQTDEAEFSEYWEGCRKAYQALIELPEFSLDTDRQAQLVRPLYLGLLDPEKEAAAKERLIRAIGNYGWRLGTGFLSTPLILYVLTEIDPAAAYRLLENEQMPGWLFMPKNGAVTVWENWEGTEAEKGVASLNHYSKGAVVEWLFDTMCGIRVSRENHFVIAPLPGGNFTYAKAGYQSIYGKVESSWEKSGDRIFYTITIPSGCTAELRLPGRKPQLVEAGTYRL